MANDEAKVKVKVDDEGTISKTRKNMKGLADDTSKVTDANKGVAAVSGKADTFPSHQAQASCSPEDGT